MSNTNSPSPLGSTIVGSSIWSGLEAYKSKYKYLYHLSELYDKINEAEALLQKLNDGSKKKGGGEGGADDLGGMGAMGGGGGSDLDIKNLEALGNGEEGGGAAEGGAPEEAPSK